MISKAKTIIKQYFFLLALVAIFVGFSAFKTNERKFVSQWFEISVNELDPENTTQQIIGDPIGSPSLDCSEDNEVTPPCAIYLDLEHFAGSSPEGMRVSLATDTLGATIDETVGANSDGYARKDPQ